MAGRYICAWCKKFLNDIVFKEELNSFGICPSCKKEMDKEIEAVKEYNARVGKKEVKK
jgi:hypothetical protein